MLTFYNDYNDIGHPEVLKKLQSCVDETLYSYGDDPYTKAAVSLLQKKLGVDANIHFVHGGTMANILALTSILKPYEAIVAPSSAHIYAHETGAMETRGHRIITVDTEIGMLDKNDLEATLAMYGEEFNVIPKIVCISNTTEYGSVYKKKQLEELYQVCKKYNVYLYIDGARLGSAMSSDVVDYTWSDLGKLCDAISVGGTKNGAMFGEALVFFHQDFEEHFRFYLKSQGAMMAKGFLIALQFIALFETSLYEDNARYANEMAMYLNTLLQENDVVRFALGVESNQIFIYATPQILDALDKHDVGYEKMPYLDKKEVVRFVMTYRTKKEDIQQLATILKNIVV